MKLGDEKAQFDALITKVLSVPRSEIIRREAEYRKQVDANPNRRGPKRKPKPASAVLGPASS